MKKFHEQLNSQERFSLRPEEKARMRSAIDAAISYNPVRTASPVQSFWYFHRTTSALVSAGLLLVVMTGTAYAAQGSLPGDLLYPIKININEPLALRAATTPSQRASVEAELATRRVEEAEQLTAQGRLTVESATILENNFIAHAENATALVEHVAQTNKGEGAQLSTELSASLEAHTEVLTRLAEAQKDTSTKEASRQIIASIASRADTLTQYQLPPASEPVVVAVAAPKEQGFARSAAVRTLSAEPASAPQALPSAATTSDENDADIAALRTGAETQLSAAESDIESDHIDASSSATFKKKAAAIRSLIEANTASSTPKGQVGARYQKALQEGVILRTHINAHKQFKDFLDSDLNL